MDDPDTLNVKINNLGNITFISKYINSEIGDKHPRDYLNSYRAFLDGHFIPEDERLWDVDMYDEFLKERVKLLYQKCKEFFPYIFLLICAKISSILSIFTLPKVSLRFKG